MNRLTIYNKTRINWVKQFSLIKRGLSLTLWECIKLFCYLKRDRDILIQSCKNEFFIDKKLEVLHSALKGNFETILNDVPYGPNTKHINFLTDYRRGIRILVSKF